MRFESAFTNLLTHPNFPPPTDVTASSLGIVQSVQPAENSGNCNEQLHHPDLPARSLGVRAGASPQPGELAQFFIKGNSS